MQGASTVRKEPIPADSGDRVDGRTAVLIIDDDPTHLRIYGWIIGAAGYLAMPALVTGDRIDYPDGNADVVVMDYRLTGQLTAVRAAEETQRRYPQAPIIVLSDMYDLPADIAPYAQAFVRKGEPAKLVETLATLTGAAGAARPNSVA
jgi:DNA-binding NtrC family response regulator